MDHAAAGPWRPLVDGAEAAPAIDAIEEIGTALASAARGPSLNGGAAGRAILYAYLAEAWPGRGFAAIGERHLDQAIDQLASVPLESSLLGGVAGVAWAVEHLTARRPALEEDLNFEVDQIMLQSLRVSPWLADFDLVFGLSGLGVYALERADRQLGRACLVEIVHRLDELAEPRATGMTWHTRADLLVPETRARHPEGYDNVGVAHGVPAAAWVLAGTCALGIEHERARRLLDAVMAWMFAQRRHDEASVFPSWVDGTSWAPARSAWCYGDPGVAACLLAAARASGEPTWADEALAVARRAAARPMGDCGVRDAGLCHGAAGLMLIYQRLWNATGEPLFADAAARWLARTLELREPGHGIGGFRSLAPPRDRPFTGELVWQDDTSLLSGSLGIALALLAAITPIEPSWDRLLALSSPIGARSR